MFIDFKQLEPNQRYFAMTQSIIPRPIAWVLSDNGLDGDEAYNLAPFSFFTGISSDPPLLIISVGKKTAGDQNGHIKDTRKNIEERKHFVVHIAPSEQIDHLNRTSASLDHGVSEIKQEKLETATFADFPLPRLESCDIALGCTLYRLDEIGNVPQAVIYGEIEKMYVADEVISSHDNRLIIDAQKLNPLARLGGKYYSVLGELLQAARPK